MLDVRNSFRRGPPRDAGPLRLLRPVVIATVVVVSVTGVAVSPATALQAPAKTITVTFPPIRNSDSPAGTRDRIPPRVPTPVNVTIAGLKAGWSVTFSIDGGGIGDNGNSTINGGPMAVVGVNGTTTLTLQGTLPQTGCGRGPHLRLQAQLTAPRAKQNGLKFHSAPFADSSIPVGYSDSFLAPISGNLETGESSSLGMIVQDSWRSDSGTPADPQLGDLGPGDCVQLTELVQPVAPAAPGRTSGYLDASRLTTDTHSSPASSITANLSRTANQASLFIDRRSHSHDICMPASGYTITRTAPNPAFNWTIRKFSAAVNVTGAITRTDPPRMATCATAGGGIVASMQGGCTLQGICLTQPVTAPRFTSAASASVFGGAVFTFTVQTTGSPGGALIDRHGIHWLTFRRQCVLPNATVVACADVPAGTDEIRTGTATLSGVAPPGPLRVFTITFEASNGVAPDATQTFMLTRRP